MKKSEKISDAVGMLDEKIVEEAAEKRNNSHKNKKSLWIKIAAAAACIAVAAGISVPLINRNGGSLVDILPTGSITAVKAVYPQAAKYPDESKFYNFVGEFDNEAFDRIYTPWWEQERARTEYGNNAADISAFVSSSAKEFLSEGAEKNKVYSPLNVYFALACLAEITDGNSRAQILELLGTDSIEALRIQMKNLWNANYRNDGATVSVLANSLWLNDNVNFKEDAVNRLAQEYYSSVFSGDFSEKAMTKALKDWINEQTGGLLKESAEQLELTPETIAAICSTVYFRAKWDNEFNQNNNDTRIFHAPDGDIEKTFMNDTNSYGVYFAAEDFGAISLAFKEGGRMWLILPDEDKTVSDVINSGEYLKLLKNNSGIPNKQLIINYSVPKFDVTSDTELTEGLKALGVTDVFNGYKSDFSPLTEDMTGIAISRAQHSARVTIDEEGCTAVAFTAMMAYGAALPPEDKMDFIVDRPFVFMIESDTNQPLFIGTVTNP